MAKYTNLNSLFTAMADELRAKKGTTEKIIADDFPTEIHNLPSGGEENIAEEMEMIDRAIEGQIPYRRFSEKDYSEKDVQELQNLIEKLGGN